LRGFKSEKSENETETREDAETQPQPENVNDESQETPQDNEHRIIRKIRLTPPNLFT
jgi:hypothetical protein